MPDLNVPAAVPVAPAQPVVPAAPAAVLDAATIKAPDGSIASTPAEKAVVNKIKVGSTDYDEATLVGLIEKANGAEKKFLEAAQARKEAYRFFKMAKENPTEFLRKTGLDPKKYAYDQVAEDVKNSLRDPKEVELEAAQKRLGEFEAKETAEKARVAEVEQTKKAQAWQAKLNQEIIEALEATPAIPKNGFSVAKIAKYMATVHAKTGVLLSPKDVVGVIEKDIRSELAGITKGASVEQLLELVGEEGLAALRKHDLERLKDPLKNGRPDNNIAQVDGSKAPQRKWRNSHEYWRSMAEEAKAEREARGQ